RRCARPDRVPNPAGRGGGRPRSRLAPEGSVISSARAPWVAGRISCLDGASGLGRRVASRAGGCASRRYGHGVVLRVGRRLRPRGGAERAARGRGSAWGVGGPDGGLLRLFLCCRRRTGPPRGAAGSGASRGPPRLRGARGPRLLAGGGGAPGRLEPSTSGPRRGSRRRGRGALAM